MSSQHSYTQLLSKLHQVRIDGRSITELFREVPDAIMYPDYRDIVETPISLLEITKRVQMQVYETDESILNDFELMADNAKQYNTDQSPVYDDSLDILDYAYLYLTNHISPPSMLKLQNLILNEVENYKYKGRRLSDAFIIEPDANTYPNYRDVVKNPTSFTKIHNQLLENGAFDSWDSFKKAVTLIFDNAMLYNLEGSPIYNDAKSLKKQVENKVKKYSQVPKYLQSALSGDGSRSGSVVSGTNGTANPTAGGAGAEAETPADFKDLKYDDDDDDDFEADFDDLEDDDELGDNLNVNSAHQTPDPQASFDINSQMDIDPLQHIQQPAVVYDELVYRPPGETSVNALIKSVTLNSKPLNSSHLQNFTPNDAKKSEKDLLQIKILPSETKAYTTYATTLPVYQSSLKLILETNEFVQPLNLAVILNGAKLQPQPLQQFVEQYDFNLSLGLNQITVIAIKPNLSGFLRQHGPPPLADAEEDEERVVVFVNLSK